MYERLHLVTFTFSQEAKTVLLSKWERNPGSDYIIAFSPMKMCGKEHTISELLNHQGTNN